MYLSHSSPFILPKLVRYPLVPMRNHVQKSNVSEQSIIIPKTDIFEDENNMYFDFEIAGVRKEDISIKINDEKVLNFTAKKYIRNQDKDGEQKFHEIKRSFQLDGEYHDEQINAVYSNGVLSVKVPKKLPVEKQIEIL